MSVLDTLAALPITRAIGWTVVHFYWQGTLIAAGAGLALGLLRNRSANARYAVCSVGMALMLLAPVLTLVARLPSEGTPAGLVLSAAFAEVVAPRLGWQRLNPLLPWVTLVWLTGFSVLQCRTLLHWTRAQHLKRHSTRPLLPTWQRAVSELCNRVGVRRAVQVVESTLADVPMLIGWLSPVILIPTGALCGLSRDQLQAVLAHELAHVRRHDSIVNLAQAALESLLFFHPAVWWISGRMRVEREYCCDDVAVQICGDTLCYARALSTLENMRGAPIPAIAANGGSLMNRIFRLAGNRPSAHSTRGQGLPSLLLATALAAVIAAAGIALAGDSRTVTEPAPEPPAEAPGPQAYEPAPPDSDEPRARLEREIADRREALESLELELRQRYGEASGAEDLRRQADWARALDARRIAMEHELQARAAQEEYLSRLGDLDNATEGRQDLELELDKRRAEAAERAAQAEYERASEGADGEDGDRLRMRRDAEASKLHAEIERLRTLTERETREAEHAARQLSREARKRRDVASEERSALAAPAEGLKRELEEQKIVIRELRRELERERLRLDATLRELERLEAGESRDDAKREKLRIKQDAAEEKSRIKDLKRDAKRNKKRAEPIR